MSETIIQIENIGKRYLIRHRAKERYVALRDVLARKAASIGRPFVNQNSKEKADLTREDFWALRGVSFEVKRGEVIGIIGRNGAGKSTLLKILSRITEPTTGRIKIKGRVASLLEVGTGFHPELTGRENIYLNGAILGMKKSEIRRKFDEIVAFSEVEKFLDTPVKRYSSGMYVRLAFGVAAHLEPEILVVDEVLAVGDSAFQKKCLNKMESVNQEGRTVLIVSHNMAVIKSLCSSAILLDHGKTGEIGPTDRVVNAYLCASADDIGIKGEINWPNTNIAPGSREIRLHSIRILGSQNRTQSVLDPEKPIRIAIEYKILETIMGMRFVLQIINADGVVAFSSTDHDLRPVESVRGIYRTVCTIPSDLLNSGKYFVVLHGGCPGVKKLFGGKEFLEFHVERSRHHGSHYPEHWPGVVAPRLHWETNPVSGDSNI